MLLEEEKLLVVMMSLIQLGIMLFFRSGEEFVHSEHSLNSSFWFSIRAQKCYVFLYCRPPGTKRLPLDWSQNCFLHFQFQTILGTYCILTRPTRPPLLPRKSRNSNFLALHVRVISISHNFRFRRTLNAPLVKRKKHER